MRLMKAKRPIKKPSGMPASAARPKPMATRSSENRMFRPMPWSNDRLIGTGASFTPPTLHVGTAELGNSPNRDVRQLVGSMDEFAVLSRALSEAEVRDFFEQGKP